MMVGEGGEVGVGRKDELTEEKGKACPAKKTQQARLALFCLGLSVIPGHRH